MSMVVLRWRVTAGEVPMVRSRHTGVAGDRNCICCWDFRRGGGVWVRGAAPCPLAVGHEGRLEWTRCARG